MSNLILKSNCLNPCVLWSRIYTYSFGTTPDQKIVGNGFQPIGILVTGNCIHQGFKQKVITHLIGQIGTQGFLEFSDMPFFLLYLKPTMVYINYTILFGVYSWAFRNDLPIVDNPIIKQFLNILIGQLTKLTFGFEYGFLGVFNPKHSRLLS